MSEENILKTMIILLCVVLITLIPVSDTNYSPPSEYPNYGLVSALNENGWELYTSSSCSACQLQKTIIGNEYNNIIKFELGTKEFAIMASYIQISGIPTWFNSNTGEKRTGTQSVEELWNMTIPLGNK